jgi:hypothetical protein
MTFGSVARVIGRRDALACRVGVLTRRSGPDMPQVLKDLQINDVSSVDRGAGRGVRVLFMKRDHGEEEMSLDTICKRYAEIRKIDVAHATVELLKTKEGAALYESERDLALLKMALNKNTDEGGEGGKPPAQQRGDSPADVLKELVRQYAKANGVKESVAYNRVLATPKGRELYEASKQRKAV